MPLQQIIWNHLWAKQLHEQVEVMACIVAHYARRGLERHGAETAFLRSTGWHGESGMVHFGSHLTVGFLQANGDLEMTHHVYRKRQCGEQPTQMKMPWNGVEKEDIYLWGGGQWWPFYTRQSTFMLMQVLDDELSCCCNGKSTQLQPKPRSWDQGGVEKRHKVSCRPPSAEGLLKAAKGTHKCAGSRERELEGEGQLL
ncbi:hypothetical protein EI94DRAFT_1708850 [Lactarius quietus]|nr:hypothetical protein EI94DRAFT_1708850 [Lactarius quietus]